MNNSIDITEELKIKNQEMLLNKKKIDLEKSMESLIVFFDNYSINFANEVNNQICLIKGIDSNSEQGSIMLTTIIGFFTIFSNKLKELILKKVNIIKEKLNNIDDVEYDKELRYMAILVNNQLLEFYEKNIDMLILELAGNEDNNDKEKINNYLYDVIYNKMMNMLKDKLSYSIKVISNNYEENKEVIENINEKTLK